METTTEMKEQEQKIRTACERWVREYFSDIPGALIERAYKDSPDDLQLLAGGSCVECDAGYGDPHEEGCAFLTDPKNATYRAVYAWPAGWGWLWMPTESLDGDWIRENAGAVAKLGFLVYDSDETGILLGIDGGGYNFYDAHWIPLYKARGLKWHE